VLLYVYDGAQDITADFDQGPIAHDFHGCLLRAAALPRVDSSSMHTPMRGVPIPASSSLRHALVALGDDCAIGGSVHGINFALQ
jgi:hypothetical protein